MGGFFLREIKSLSKLSEVETQQLILSLPEEANERVEKAKTLYQKLRDAYTSNGDKLISDLILSEEESPYAEMEALIKRGKSSTPALIHLISSPFFYDPLSPGYGRSPLLAAKCLAKIKDEKAIPPLFEAIGQGDFESEMAILEALASFGEEAKAFLIKRVMQTPLSIENEHAALALSRFADDPEIVKLCLKLLESEGVLKRQSLGSHLAVVCSMAEDQELQARFIALTESKEIRPLLLSEMQLIIKGWKRKEASTKKGIDSKVS